MVFSKRHKVILLVFVAFFVIFMSFYFIQKDDFSLLFNSMEARMENCLLIEYGEGETICPEGYYVPEVGENVESSGYMRCCKINKESVDELNEKTNKNQN